MILSDNPLTKRDDCWEYWTHMGIIALIVIAVVCAAVCFSSAARASIGDNQDRKIERSAPKIANHRATHRAARKRTRVVKVVQRKQTVAVVRSKAEIVGSRPAECHIRIAGRLIPYCMCALSVKIFGKVIPDLNLAANWPKRFPKARPEPGMVAARPGHGFQLLAHVRGDVWKVWDANSGGGLIRIHERSIAGYQIVNPHASRMAMVR